MAGYFESQADRYGSELDKIGDLLTKLHPAGEYKHIGRMECYQALKELVEDLKIQPWRVSMACVSENS